jgi:hypothetical protein
MGSISSKLYVYNEMEKSRNYTWPNVILPAAPANTYVLGSVTPLEPYTTYEVQIANQCNGETTLNPYSNLKYLQRKEYVKFLLRD